MLYSTAGVPDRASEWCERILQRLVAVAAGEPACFVADDLQQIGAHLLAAPQSVAVVTSRIVENRLCDALLAGGKPLLVTLAPPESAIKSLIADYGLCFPDAVRRVACSMTSLLPLLNHPNTLVVDYSAAPSARAVAEKLVRHFAIPITGDAIQQALKDIPEKAPRVEGDLVTLVEGADRKDIAVRAGTASRYGFATEAVTPESIIKGAVEPVWTVIQGGVLQDITWHPLLFLLGDADAKPPVAALDVTGPSRCLIYGPYIGLPKGAWTSRMTVKMEGDAAGTNLRIEVWAGEMLKFIELPLRSPGLVDVELLFDSPGAGCPVELRVFKADSASEGLLVFGTVLLRACA